MASLPFRRRTIALPLAAAFSALAAGSAVVLAQTAGSSENRISDDFRPQRLDPNASELAPTVPTDEPAEELQQPLDLDQELNAPEPPADPEEAEAAPEGQEVRDFDLFSGAREPRAERLGLANVQAGRAAAAGQEAEEEGASTRSALSPVFDPIGPVRTPTLAASDPEARLNSAISGLRRSLPLMPDDPYAAEGIRTGRFLLYPSIEQSVGVSDNLSNSPSGESGVFSQTTLSTRLLSDWSRHQLELNGAASYRRNFSGPLPEEPRLDLDGQLRLDVSRDWTATLRGAVAYSRESAFSADPLVPAEERPDILAYSAGADIERAVGPTTLTFTGQVVREEREPVSGAATTDDFSTYSAGLRAQYEISPSLQPFVTASLGRRVFDEDRDPLGRERDSLIPALRLGVGFDRGEKFFGEVAVGYAANLPDEETLGDKGSPTLDARINWSPRRGTDVVLAAATYFDPARDNLATSTVYETSLGIRHRATAKLDVTGLLGFSYRDQSNFSDEIVYAAEAGVTYWLRRGLALTALARHERLESETVASEYDATSFRVGLRVER